MTRLLRGLVVALAALSSLCAPLKSVAESVLEFSIRSENRLALTMLSDALSDSAVTFSASRENGVTELQIDLDDQTIYVRKSAGELYIHSSKNTDRTFSTLTEDEKVVLGTMANLMEESLEQHNRFYAATVCLMKHFSYWPPEMPLMVSLDPVHLTVGELRLDREEMKEARRQALAEAGAQDQQAAPESPAGWSSLCSYIGSGHTACYPTSLIPYRERCDSVMVGGTSCRGRCGTTCYGLCSGKKYTQDCFNHDRCAEVQGIIDFRCDVIFVFCMDDCVFAPDCADFPGLWVVGVGWNDGLIGWGNWWVYPWGVFVDDWFFVGTWTQNGDFVRVEYPYSGGYYCSTVLTGFLAPNGLRLTGTMVCPEVPWLSGDFDANKTNWPVSALVPEQARPSSDSAVNRRVGPTSEPAPSPADSTVNPPHKEVEK